MKTKRWTRSRTIWVNAVVTASGVIIYLANLFGKLALLLTAVNLDALPEDLATWVTTSGIVALVSAINVILRAVTSQPISGTKAAKRPGGFSPDEWKHSDPGPAG